MNEVRFLKPRSVFSIMGIITIIICGALNVSANRWFVILLLLWTLMFIYTLDNVAENVVMCFFLISFFVFLLGREFIYEFFGGEKLYTFLDVTNNKTFILLILSLFGIGVGSYLIKSPYKFTIGNRTKFKQNFKEYKTMGREYQSNCKIMFFLCYFAAIISVIYKIIFVRKVGYLASYTSEAGGSGVPSIITYIANFLPVILSITTLQLFHKKISYRAF